MFSEHEQENKDLHYSHITAHKLSPKQKLHPSLFYKSTDNNNFEMANKTKTHVQKQLNDMSPKTLNEKLENKEHEGKYFYTRTF